MFSFLRRRRATYLSRVELCDSCGQVCTPQCRAAAHDQRVRTAALTHFIPR